MAHVVEKWAAQGTDQLFDTEEGALAAEREIRLERAVAMLADREDAFSYGMDEAVTTWVMANRRKLLALLLAEKSG